MMSMSLNVKDPQFSFSVFWTYFSKNDNFKNSDLPFLRKVKQICLLFRVRISTDVDMI